MKDITYKDKNIKFNFRVAAIIENQDRILVQHSQGDTNYRLVGGRVQLMESTLQALVREIHEELNYTIKGEDLRLLQIAENFYDYDDIDGSIQNVHEILFVYKLYIDSNNDIAKMDNFKEFDKDNTILKWIKKKDLDNISLVPQIAKKIIDSTSLNYEIINDIRNT